MADANTTESGLPQGTDTADRDEARREAAELLRQGLPKPEIRDRLQLRGLSRRTAYRVIDAAVEELGQAAPGVVSEPSPAFAHREPSTGPSDVTNGATDPEKRAETPAPARRTLRVRVTHLHAPWPQGTMRGNVVCFEGRHEVPEWAAGKCQLVPDTTPADYVWRTRDRPSDGVSVFPDLQPRDTGDALADRVAALRAELDTLAAELEAAQGRARQDEADAWRVIADFLRPELEAAQERLVSVAARWAAAYARGHGTAAPLPDFRQLALEAATTA